VRLAVAKDAGLGEDTIAKVFRRDDNDLAPHHRVALRLADALMTMPASIDEDLRVELQRHFSPKQIIELTLDVMKWNYQKTAVALRIDVEVRPGELADLIFDERGNWVRPS
jgi:alkylhydroperoxidase family enzyme